MPTTRRTVLRATGAAGLASLLGSGPVAADARRLEQRKHVTQQVAVTATQEAGESVHWILPGPRRIDPHVFGTPEAGPSTPQRGDDYIAHKVWYYEQHRPAVVGLLAGDADHDPLPLPVGLPEAARGTNAAEDRYTATRIPVPFSDDAIGSDDAPRLDGELAVTYVDRRGHGAQAVAGDDVDLDLWFTDPDGTRYTVDVHHLETHDGAHLHGHGVMTGVYMHGTVPIGTPLMPTQYAYGSLWAIGDLLVDGEVTADRNRNRVVHLMTTQNVRTADYRLAIDAELPLGEHGNPDPYRGSHVVTHAFLPPIQATPDGPRRVPLEPAFELPDGTPQPFVHVMFDESTASFDRAVHP